MVNDRRTLFSLPPCGGGSGRGLSDGSFIAYFVTVGPTTSTLPVSVCACRSGSYMSSTVAAGCTKRPGETARTP